MRACLTPYPGRTSAPGRFSFKAPAEAAEPTEDSFAIEFVDEDGSVTTFGNAEDEAAIQDPAPVLRALEQAGIRTAEGIAYCGNDPAFYLKMLRDFPESSRTRSDEMERALAAHDLHSYAVSVHALKSNARTLGFPDIPCVMNLSRVHPA